MRGRFLFIETVSCGPAVLCDEFRESSYTGDVSNLQNGLPIYTLVSAFETPSDQEAKVLKDSSHEAQNTKQKDFC